MSGEQSIEKINQSKVNLNHIYNRPDPRAYFRELRKLEYAIPGVGKPVFQKLISYLNRRNKGTVHVLDLGCSYGVNAALLKYDLTMSDLYEHWRQAMLAGATTKEVMAYDRRFFHHLEETEDIEMIGLDRAENAITYAEKIDLLDEALVADLETQPLPETAEQKLAEVDLVISSGCIGYITNKSFERLLPAVIDNRSPWFANFVLRMFPFDVIEQTLRNWGYVTEKLEGQTFIQRHFASEEEQGQVLRKLRDQGIDPAGKEMEGYLQAEFYLSRPIQDAEQVTLDELLAA